MKATHYRTDRNVEHFGDFFVVKPFDIGQQNRQPERFWQCVDRRLHLGVGEGFEGDVFGSTVRFDCFEAAHTPVEEQILDFFIQVGLSWLASLGPVGVDIGIGEDTKQPRP